MSSPVRTEQVRHIFEDQLDLRDIKLPMLPRVATMVIQLTTDENADAKQLTKLIQSDQALAGYIMRVANSPIYRPVSAFVSLQQAIARLGINCIAEIALSTSLNADLFNAPGQEKLLNRLWHDALTCSAWSREIARMRRTNVESSFLAGLLCQIGKPVVVQGVAEFGLDDETMLQFIDQYHIRAGALLANIWKLPEIVGQAIIHHRFDDYDGEHEDVILNVQAGLGLAREGGLDNMSVEIREKLNFYAEDIEILEAKRQVVDAWVNTVDG